ncbi:hypothetical protein NEUTE1DRAFT_118914 [Neurospora tetrasperma FGSC 2508]|uniref:Uncharacterized protein n=1 Tax=Neurospora tetrasperma (strain FGSC 2508 / ATCC MYA-4615 / P0657) TaxID=510951 RepID=F8N4W1_NEUT8|nr:uncharacterized protein NEUTE1DRAFT_118914 [Neurospora tetrasperma FGSC 2508]EGO52745.1 hypothetical protein NEUTE1DRAFT_118914 [Neurospora tetrasperma FGSC 2508]
MERCCDLKLFNMEEGAEILREIPKPQQAAFLHPSHGHPYPWRTPKDPAYSDPVIARLLAGTSGRGSSMYAM